MKQVGIVICNYNKRDFVLGCIESVFASDFTDFDVIVVDNASTDGSAEAVREKYGDRLTLLANEENTGGSGGFNLGMTCAIEKEYKYIQLLDNDVVVDKNAIGVLYDYMETHSEMGACGSLIMKMHEPEYIQEFGAVVDADNLGSKQLFSGERRTDDLPEKMDCEVIPACSALYRVDALKVSGPIDENFFLYWDDIALCKEILLAGYKICALSRSVVWHAGGAGTIANTMGFYYGLRNKTYYLVKYCSDKDYASLANSIVRRLFRSFAVNRDNQEIIYTYFHALDDALNNVRGKADPYKIKPIPFINTKFADKVKNTNKILIQLETQDFNLGIFVLKLRSVSDAVVHAVSRQYEIPKIATVEYPENIDLSKYDLNIIACSHILDVGSYDKTKLYVDKYFNQITDESDFEFYENMDDHYEFFYEIFGEFVKSKLDAMRERLRKVEI